MIENILINKLALGTVQFGLDYGISNGSGQVSFEDANDIINTANKYGIHTLDTASAYGKSEEVLGKLHLNKFDIVTKFVSETKELSIEKQFMTSLDNLKLSKVYGYIAHKPIDVFEQKDLWRKINNFKDQGKVEKIGFSFDSPEEYIMMEKKGFVPELVQLPYNYFDQRFLIIIEKLKQKGCEIHARSPFLQGLFFSNVDNLSKQFDPVKAIIKDLQTSHNSSLQGALLKYVIKNPLIDKVVFGVQNRSQLVSNIESITKASDIAPLNISIENNIVQPNKWSK
ncbi:MAG: aryl-alcohol dehydrogenase-like predicted oxidoreductase [Psychroserpens sp.]|jgi:aryl-alcohol dehydrogenase-like predicted oxidoreductase